MNAVGLRSRATRLARLSALIAISLTGLTCRDSSVTGPGLPSRANLTIAPRFQVVEGGPSIVLHQARAELFRLPGGSLAGSEVGTFAADGSDLEMSLSVILSEAQEMFVLRIAATNANGDTVFRSVDSSVVLRRGLLAGEAVPVILSYSGADVLAVSLATSPEDTTIDVGTSATFRAVAKKADSTVIAAPVGWRSSDSTKLRVTDAGVATALSEFTGLWLFARTATGLVDSSRVSAVRPVGSVVISPAGSQVVIGRTLQMAASVRGTDNSEQPTRLVTWSSSNTAIATVSQTGLVTGVAAGTVTITARSGGVDGTMQVTVIVAPVATVEVAPADTTVFIGDTLTMRRILRDDQGAVLSNRLVLWTSLDPAIAQVNQSTGFVTALAEGTARIVATSEGKFAQGVVRVVRLGTTLTTSEVKGVYGGSVTLIATLTRNGVPVSGKVISFKLFGVDVGSAITDAQGVATRANVSLGTTSVGTYGPPSVFIRGVDVTFGGDATLLPSSASARVIVEPAPVTLVLGNLTQVYDGTPKAATVTASPEVSGVTISYSQNGQAVAAPTDAGSYTVTATLNNPNYTAAPVSGTLVITAGTQQITFAALPARTFGEAPFKVTASSSSDMAVTYSASGSCSVDSGSGMVTLTSAGSCTITASQPGNANYAAATPVSQTFAINPANATLTLGNLSHVYDGTPKAASVATSPAGLSGVTILYNGSSQLPVAAGSHAVFASLSNPNYVAQSVSGTMVIAKALQTISWADITSWPYKVSDAPFGLTATASSGLPVTFTASGVCSVAGNTVTINAAGSCTITAQQDGDANYNPASPVSQTFTVAQGTATITLSNLEQPWDGKPKFATVTTSPPNLSGVTVLYDGQSQAPTEPGSYTVRAFLKNPDWTASEVTNTLIITRAAQTITYDPIPPLTYDGKGDVFIPLSARSSSGLPVDYSLVSGPCYDDGGVHAYAAGSCGVVWSQSGDEHFLPAEPETQIITINKGQAQIVIENSSKAYSGEPQNPDFSTNPSGLEGSVVFTYEQGFTPSEPGQYPYVATLNHQNYQAEPVKGTLVIYRLQSEKSSQFITFPAFNPDTMVFGDQVPQPTAYSNSGLGIEYSVSENSSGVCSFDGPTLYAHGVGSCVVIASQSGNERYYAASPVSQTLTIVERGSEKAVVSSIEVSPSSATLAPDGTQQLKATARDQYRNVMAGVAFSWWSSNTDVASVMVTGETSEFATVTARGDGAATIYASVGDVYGTSVINVGTPAKATQTLTVDPIANRNYEDGTFAVTATSSSGNWYVSDLSGACYYVGDNYIGMQSPNVGTCTVIVYAPADSIYEEATQSVQFEVGYPDPSDFEVTPFSATLPMGSTQEMVARPLDQSRNEIPGLLIEWASLNDSVATVPRGATGRTVTVTPVSEGTAAIQAVIRRDGVVYSYANSSITVVGAATASITWLGGASREW